MWAKIDSRFLLLQIYLYTNAELAQVPLRQAESQVCKFQ